MSTAALKNDDTELTTLEAAKEAARLAPLVLSDETGLSHVLLRITDYERLLQGKLNIVEMLWMPGMVDIDFEPQREMGSMRPVDLS